MDKARGIRLSGIALLLCLLVALMFWNNSRTSGGTEEGSKRRVSRSREFDADEATRRSANARPLVDPAPSPDDETPEARHFRNFYVRPILFPVETNDTILPISSNISLPEAIAKLKTEYEETASETREATLPITVDLSKANMSKSIGLRSPRAPVLSVLRLIAAASGNRLLGSGPDFRMEAVHDDGKRYNLTENVMGLYLERLGDFSSGPDLPGSSVNGDAGDPSAGPADPFAEHTEPKPTELKDLLARMGLKLDPAIRLSVDETHAPHRTVGIENATAADMETLRAALSLASTDTPQIQNQLATKVLTIPADAEWAAGSLGNLDAGAYGSLLDRYGSGNSGLIDYPTIAARPGQPGTIEIIRQYVDPENPQLPPENIGMTLHYSSQPLGTGTEDQFQFNQSGLGPDGRPLPATRFTGRSAGGPGSAFTMEGTAPDGSKLLYIQTRTRLDNTGMPVADATFKKP